MHIMTTKQTISYLKPLRADVSEWHQRVLDKLATGVTADDCQGRFDGWREAVRTYLDALESAEVNTDQLDTMIAELSSRLDTGFEMPVPENGQEAWKLDKHFAKLLAELEVCCDLQSGHRATRTWLLGQDARLRMAIRRMAHPQPIPKTEHEEVVH